MTNEDRSPVMRSIKPSTRGSRSIGALHNREIICPECKSSKISKNGHRRGKQNYICRDCERQFVEYYSCVGYSDEIKQQCLKMYVNGTGFRAIERQTGVNHNTVIN